MSIPDFSRNLAPRRGIPNIHARFRVSAILPRFKKPQIERKLDFRIGSQWSVPFAPQKSQFAGVTGLAALLKSEAGHHRGRAGGTSAGQPGARAQRQKCVGENPK